MRIIKPEWLRHDADKKKLTAVFSVDFHPDGTRLATAGMDNKIRIWNTQAIVHQKDDDKGEETGSQQRLLSTLTAHTGAVMCVRFSPGSGQYLASGADDMIVLIWERDMGESATGDGNLAGLGASETTETWRPVRRLTGHESDVADIAWSPDGRWLATCGLDNTVHVWDAKSFDRVAKITGHSQFVKGITFDPAGKYLATQSDDKTMKIWRTSDWLLQTTVAKPFEDNIFSTYFRRPSWSPDGDCVAAANAANGKVPVAAVVSRGEWKADLSFVGHRAAIEAVRFNPRVFNAPVTPPPPDAADKPTGGGEDNPDAVTAEDGSFQDKEDQSPLQPAHTVASICAAGGQDRGITVWLTCQHMPIAAATNLFIGNLLDLAWHTVEYSQVEDAESQNLPIAYLAACSYDGTVAVLEFTTQELGTPIPISDQEEMLAKHGWIRPRNSDSISKRKRAGYSIIDDSDDDNSQNKKPRPIAESVTQLQLEQQGLVIEKVEKGSRIDQIMTGGLETTDAAFSQSIENTNPHETEAPQASSDNAQPSVNDMPVPVRTKDGRKRVAPMFLRPLGGSATPARKLQKQQTAESSIRSVQSASAPSVVIANPSDSVQYLEARVPMWIEARVLGTRCAHARHKGDGQDICQVIGDLGPQTLIHAQSVSAARVHLSVPKVVVQLSRPIDTYGCSQRMAPPEVRFTLVAVNNSKGKRRAHNSPQSRVTCTVQIQKKTNGEDTVNEPPLWVHFFSVPVILLSGSLEYACVCLVDGSMHWFCRRTGARLVPPIMREAHPSHLMCSGKHCLLLDSVGMITVWDLETLSTVVDNVSVAPLLYSAEMRYLEPEESDETLSEDCETEKKESSDKSAEQTSSSELKSKKKNKISSKGTNGKKKPDCAAKEPKDTSTSIEDSDAEDTVRAPRRHKPRVAITAAYVHGTNGLPIVGLSDGRTFLYNISLKSWLKLGDPRDHTGSDYALLPSVNAMHKQTLDGGKRELTAIWPTQSESSHPLAFIQEVGSYQHERTSALNGSRSLSTILNIQADGLHTEERLLVTLDHVESLILAAAQLDSPEEVMSWSEVYARYLAQLGDKRRVTRYLAKLLGPPLLVADKATKGRWEPYIGGIEKRMVLRKVLPILAANRHLQSVVSEYSDALS